MAIGWVVDEIGVQMNGDRWDEAASGGSSIFILLVFVGLIVWRGFDTAIRVIVLVYLVVLAGNMIANVLWDDVNWLRALRGTLLLVVLFLAILAGIRSRVVGDVFGIWSVVLVAVVGGWRTVELKAASPGRRRREPGADLETGGARRPSRSLNAASGTPARGPEGYPVQGCRLDRRRLHRAPKPASAA